MTLTILDLILLFIIFLFSGFGFWSGIIKSLGTLFGLVAGIWLAGKYYVCLGLWASPYLFGREGVAKVLAFIVIFFIVNGVVGLIFFILDKIFHLISFVPFLKSINRLGGLLLGFIVGVLIIGTVLFIISKYSNNEWWNNFLGDSVIADWTRYVAGLILPLLPDALKKLQSMF